MDDLNMRCLTALNRASPSTVSLKLQQRLCTAFLSPLDVTSCPHAGEGRLWQAMRLALEVWYKLWEKAGSEGRPDSDRYPVKEILYDPRRQDNLA
jgi:hypothetical protein